MKIKGGEKRKTKNNKKQISNPSHNILKLYNVLVQV